MALTDAWLKANNGKQREKTEELADRDSMSIRMSPRGKITYQLRYRYDGKFQRVDIGSYPLMSLKDARIETQRLRALLEQGFNPRTTKQVEKQAIIEADTINTLFYKWYESYCVDNKKGHVEIRRTFELYVLPKIGNLPANKVTLHEWLFILESKAKESESIASRILTNSKQMIKWAIKRKVIDTNVLADINACDDLNVKKHTTDRVLSDDEIRLVWLAIEKSRIAYKNKIFIKLCLIYGCRNGELRLSEKSHFDFDKKIWSVPPENHKIGACKLNCVNV
ncbi:integrase family protein [Moraxellaceae bacterium AER2_44_116]|nr:integrase family protein [Moraxellaceae bacterium]TQC95763.1 integrase family protein [Moraxellaceae bacterium AER2_44_116]